MEKYLETWSKLAPEEVAYQRRYVDLKNFYPTGDDLLRGYPAHLDRLSSKYIIQCYLLYCIESRGWGWEITSEYSTCVKGVPTDIGGDYNCTYSSEDTTESILECLLKTYCNCLNSQRVCKSGLWRRTETGEYKRFNLVKYHKWDENGRAGFDLVGEFDSPFEFKLWISPSASYVYTSKEDCVPLVVEHEINSIWKRSEFMSLSKEGEMLFEFIRE